MKRNRWQLTDTRVPIPVRRLPVGATGIGRFVQVTVASPSSARFAERRTLAGAMLSFPFLTRLGGEVRLEDGLARVSVYASALSVLTVGLVSVTLMAGGVQFFLSRPALGTALAGGALAAVGSFLVLQIPRVGRDVAADAVRILVVTARESGAAGERGAGPRAP